LSKSRSLMIFGSSALLTTALVSCGGPLTAQAPGVSVVGQIHSLALSYPGKYGYVHTLKIPSTLSKSSLQTTYGGKVLAFNPELGAAIVANNVSSKQLYDVVVEVNANNIKLGDVKALGFSAWSTGYSAWSTGYSAWSTGTTTAATTFSENLPSWNAIRLADAQTLVPELGRGVKVAVIDTGIDLNHGAFAGHLDTVNMYDFLLNTSSPQEVNASLVSGTSSDGYGHGTAVADLILQVAPNATVLPLRVLDGYAVTSGAKVINLSLGSGSDSSAIDSAISTATSKGVTVIEASGNTGDTNVLYPAYNAYGTTTNVTPGQPLGSVSVGSVTTGLLKSSFSTYGSHLELLAPGENLKTAFPGNSTVLATGTSFAAPLVSGAAALALSTGLVTSKSDVSAMIANLDSTATAPTDPVYGPQLGNGTVNIYNFVHKYR
jgi:thermitase